MGLFHPCRIIEIVKKDKEVAAADDTIQLIVEAWDELQWAVSLDPNLNGHKVSVDDIVLVDWSLDHQTKAPRMNAIKILKGRKGLNVWKSYKDYLKKQKVKSSSVQPSQPPLASYMG